MKAHFPEGVLDLPGGWSDKSVNVYSFEPSDGRISAIRTKEDARVPFDDYCVHIRRMLEKNLSHFKLVEDRRTNVQGLVAQRVECTWRRDGETIHHIQLLVDYGDSFIVFTMTAPDAEHRPLLQFEKTLLESVRFRKPETLR